MGTNEELVPGQLLSTGKFPSWRKRRWVELNEKRQNITSKAAQMANGLLMNSKNLNEDTHNV